jgi:hypothetical protein
MIWAVALLLFAAPFWESRAPEKWSNDELRALLSDSPWAQMLSAPGSSVAPPVEVYLATAGPMEKAERERDRRAALVHPVAQDDPLVADYRGWVEENRGKQIVLAVAVSNSDILADDQEVRRMENECVMRVGKKKFKMTGHFPPSPGDRFLRLAFPREAQVTDKSVIFELYLPGVPMPFREAEFRVKDMLVNGKLEM